MATNTEYLHSTIKNSIVVGGDQTIQIIYPTTTSNDVIFHDDVSNSKLPTGVTKLTGVLNQLGTLAFKDKVELADAATNDGAGQEIESTYIKGVTTTDGKKITITYGDER